MKKLFLILILFPIAGNAQIYNYPYVPAIQYQTNNPFLMYNNSMDNIVQVAAILEQTTAIKNAAYNEAMKDNYSKVAIDNLINNTNDYEYIVIKNISGWNSKGNKMEIINTLRGHKKYLIYDISPDYKSNGKEIESEKTIPDDLKQNPKVLFVSWHQEAEGEYNRISKLTIKNFEDKIIYESSSKNLSYQEILKPLISNYILTKELAISKLQEYKKYLDLGIITKEEYDLKLAKYKPIILDDND